jgi:hypothetical protein
MRKFTLTSFLFTLTLWGISQTAIMNGQDVNFDLDNIHNSVEVSEATWNSNGTTPLAGGWALPLGGGMVPSSMLEVGTHWYVCQPHASMGMKGIIVVEGSTSTDELPGSKLFSIYPNPSSGNIQLFLTEEALISKDARVEIFDASGNQVYSAPLSRQEDLQEIEISLAGYAKGLYIVRFYDDQGIHSRKLILQ